MLQELKGVVPAEVGTDTMPAKCTWGALENQLHNGPPIICAAKTNERRLVARFGHLTQMPQIKLTSWVRADPTQAYACRTPGRPVLDRSGRIMKK